MRRPLALILFALAAAACQPLQAAVGANVIARETMDSVKDIVGLLRRR